MYTRVNLFIYVFSVLIFASSCKKEFFDLNPYDASPLEGAINNDADLNVITNGIYAGLLDADITDNDEASLYGRTLPIRGDLAADNLYLKTNNSGRYLIFRDFNQTVADPDVRGVWNDSYDVIKRANTVINSTIESTEITDQLRGEAYAIRALLHFELLRNFAKPYTVDPAALGVPIVTEFDQNAQPARNTSAEVYAQIIEDLNQAFTLMTQNQGDQLTISSTGTTRIQSSSYFSKYAAKALLARVYQHMGNWEEARNAALEVVNNSGFSLVTAGDYINFWADPSSSTDKVETIFEVASDASNNLSSNSLSNFYSLDGYGDVFVTNDLYNLYTSGDVRRDLIIETNAGGNPVYMVEKYPNTTNPADKDDTKVLRYADVILILAEAYANLNDETNARQYLNELVRSRIPGFAGYTSTGVQLMADIIKERRLEFAFEGYRYWDLLRLNLPVNNHIKSQSPLVPFPIEANNTYRIFPIPQQEIDVNENIRGQQNEGY